MMPPWNFLLFKGFRVFANQEARELWIGSAFQTRATRPSSQFSPPIRLHFQIPANEGLLQSIIEHLCPHLVWISVKHLQSAGPINVPNIHWPIAAAIGFKSSPTRMISHPESVWTVRVRLVIRTKYKPARHQV